MGDVRELARECRELWAASDDGDRRPFAPWAMVDRGLGNIVAGREVTPASVGWFRNAVERECEQRGWGTEWRRYREGGHGFGTKGFKTHLELEFGSPTALGCALLALKWLLENPVEVSDG